MGTVMETDLKVDFKVDGRYQRGLFWSGENSRSNTQLAED